MIYEKLQMPTEKTKLTKDCEWSQNLRYSLAELPGNKLNVVGIDPGVNFGFCVIHGKRVHIYHGKLNTRPKTERSLYSVDAEKLTEWLLLGRVDGYDMILVEGAAYGKKFGQVQLAEVRTGYLHGALGYSDDVSIIPPSTARKEGLGHGNAKASELWPTLNHNACDAVAIAMAALERLTDG